MRLAIKETIKGESRIIPAVTKESLPMINQRVIKEENKEGLFRIEGQLLQRKTVPFSRIIIEANK